MALLHFRQKLGDFLAHGRRQFVILQHVLERAKQPVFGLFQLGHVTIVGVAECSADLAIELLHRTDHGAVLGRLATAGSNGATQCGDDAALDAGNTSEQGRQFGILHLGRSFLVERLSVAGDLDQIVEAVFDGGLGAHGIAPVCSMVYGE